MKRIYLLYFLSFLNILLFATPYPQNFEKAYQERSDQEPVFNTLKDELTYTFDNIRWVSDGSLKSRTLAMPYKLEEQKQSEVYLFAQVNEKSLIKASLEGLGELNYVAVEQKALDYCKLFSEKLRSKKLDDTEVSQSRPFLKYFFESLLSEYPEARSVFYGRPERYDDIVEMRFRLNFSQSEAGLAYALVKASAVNENEKLVLYDFEIGNIKYEKIE